MNLYQDFMKNSKSASPAQEELISKGRNTAKVDPYLVAMVNDDRFSDEEIYRAVTQGTNNGNKRTPTYNNQVPGNFYQDRYDDYYTSRGEPIPQKSRGEHLWSRREDTGEILKVPPINNEGGHPSFHLTARADDKAGYKFYIRNDPSIGPSPLNGRLYSFNKKEWATKNPKNWNMVPQSTVDEWKWQPYKVPEIMSYIQQWEVYHTNTGSIKHSKNGYNSSEDLFYMYTDSNGHATFGIGHKASGDREADTRRLLKQIAPHISYEELMAKRQGLTEAEVREFFFYDTREHITEAEKMFPLIYAEPDYMKQILVSGRYQGFFKEKHNTVKYLQEAQAAFHIQDYETALEFYQKAADASLNRTDYREQKIKDAARDEPIRGGFVDRYDDIKNSILKRVDEVKQLLNPDKNEDPSPEQKSITLKADTKEYQIKSMSVDEIVEEGKQKKQKKESFIESLKRQSADLYNDFIAPKVDDALDAVNEWSLTSFFGKERAVEIREWQQFYKEFPEEAPKDAVNNPLFDYIKNIFSGSSDKAKQGMIDKLEHPKGPPQPIPASYNVYEGYIGQLLPHGQIQERFNDNGKVYVPENPEDYNAVARKDGFEEWQVDNVLDQILMMQPPIQVGSLFVDVDMSSLTPFKNKLIDAHKIAVSVGTQLLDYIYEISQEWREPESIMHDLTIYLDQLVDSTLPSYIEGTFFVKPIIIGDRTPEDLLKWLESEYLNSKPPEHINDYRLSIWRKEGGPSASEYDRYKREINQLLDAYRPAIADLKWAKTQLYKRKEFLLNTSELARSVPQGFMISSLPSLTVFDWVRSQLGVSVADYKAHLKIYYEKRKLLTPEKQKMWDRMFGTEEMLNNELFIGVIPEEQLEEEVELKKSEYLGLEDRTIRRKKMRMDIVPLVASEEDDWRERIMSQPSGKQWRENEQWDKDQQKWIKIIPDRSNYPKPVQTLGAAIRTNQMEFYNFLEDPIYGNEIINRYKAVPPQFRGKLGDLPPDELMMHLVRVEPEYHVWRSSDRTYIHDDKIPISETNAEFPQQYQLRETMDADRGKRTDEYRSRGRIGKSYLVPQELMHLGSPRQVVLFYSEDAVTLDVARHELRGHGGQSKGANRKHEGIRPRPDGSLVEEWSYLYHEIGAEFLGQLQSFKAERSSDTLAPTNIADFRKYIQNKIGDPDEYTYGQSILNEILDILDNFSDAEKEAFKYLSDATNNNRVETLIA